jgi:hypothetical protein
MRIGMIEDEAKVAYFICGGLAAEAREIQFALKLIW